MLYAAALAAGGRMYNEPDLIRQAEQVRNVIRRQSFDGEFFVDNAVRKDGRLQVTQNRTEVCQYFAFFFDIATPQTYGELWGKLLHQFGPERKQTNAFSEIMGLLPLYSICISYLAISLSHATRRNQDRLYLTAAAAPAQHTPDICHYR